MSNNIIVMYPVQGEEGAFAYPVGPNQKVNLIDTENAVIYVKSANQFGQALPLEVYDLVFRKPPVVETPVQKVEVPKGEIEAAVKEALRKYFPQMTFDD